MAFTFFCRDTFTLDLIQEHIFPRLKEHRTIKIWDAGCATGQEPYTMAMLLRDQMGEFQFRNVRIMATDIDPNFGEIIKKAEYPHEQVDRVPADWLNNYFVKSETPNHYKIKESITNSITFKHHDLTSLEPVDSGFGLIICKNVLLHLSASQRIEVIKMFYDSLAPGGHFATETTQKLPEDSKKWFEAIHGEGPVYVKRAA